MSSNSFQKRRTLLPSSVTVLAAAPSHALPVSQSDSKSTQQGQRLRRRLSSALSFKIHYPRSTSWASLQKSKSMGQNAGNSIRKWWDWGWSWILSRKPIFAEDLETNEEETQMLGSHSRGSWRHVFLKVRSEIRKLLRSDKVGLPQTYRYDSVNYSKNFDN